MEIDNLTGRELDMAVARHLLGYEVEERIDITTGEKDAFSQQPVTKQRHCPGCSKAAHQRPGGI
jgi:hypothetical protein